MRYRSESNFIFISVFIVLLFGIVIVLYMSNSKYKAKYIYSSCRIELLEKEQNIRKNIIGITLPLYSDGFVNISNDIISPINTKRRFVIYVGKNVNDKTYKVHLNHYLSLFQLKEKKALKYKNNLFLIFQTKHIETVKSEMEKYLDKIIVLCDTSFYFHDGLNLPDDLAFAMILDKNNKCLYLYNIEYDNRRQIMENEAIIKRLLDNKMDQAM